MTLWKTGSKVEQSLRSSSQTTMEWGRGAKVKRSAVLLQGALSVTGKDFALLICLVLLYVFSSSGSDFEVSMIFCT